MSDVEVHIELAGITQSVGLLRHHVSGRGETATFEYSEEWLGCDARFSIEPALHLSKGVFAPPAGQPLFGSLGDSAPDTWGRRLMQRAERRNAEHEGSCHKRGRSMTKVRVAGFTLSLDGFAAGPEQSLDQPLGLGGEALHRWLVGTKTFHAMTGEEGGTSGIDETYAARSMQGMGAWILGRNMFGPVRGAWPDESWKGWWGDTPPYHCPVFVLTRHARAPVEMEGGTVFHFVTGGIDEALARAREAAGGADIRIGGGASTIRQYLQAGAIDELHLAISPMLLGGGEALFAGIDLPALGYAVVEHAQGENAMHVVLARQTPSK